MRILLRIRLFKWCKKLSQTILFWRWQRKWNVDVKCTIINDSSISLTACRSLFNADVEIYRMQRGGYTVWRPLGTLDNHPDMWEDGRERYKRCFFKALSTRETFLPCRRIDGSFCDFYSLVDCVMPDHNITCYWQKVQQVCIRNNVINLLSNNVHSLNTKSFDKRYSTIYLNLK